MVFASRSARLFFGQTSRQRKERLQIVGRNAVPAIELVDDELAVAPNLQSDEGVADAFHVQVGEKGAQSVDKSDVLGFVAGDRAERAAR
ncbi:ribonuclease H [Gracilaria domingensis]|nr:ribonuclease H [Gracilaria domingensis]